MSVFIGLLRAVNVGGTGKLPMPAFRTACEAAGLGHVSTYIASGNVVCSSDKSASCVRELIREILSERFGLPNNDPVIRTPSDLVRIITRNPFSDAAEARPNLLQVHFLDGPPSRGAEALLAGFDGPERLLLDGQHLYIDYVAGIGRSKLTPAILDKMLQVPSTGRNWNTILKLRDMAQAIGG
jgi:uncharacterized protein (DUF1697 family)